MAAALHKRRVTLASVIYATEESRQERTLSYAIEERYARDIAAPTFAICVIIKIRCFPACRGYVAC